MRFLCSGLIELVLSTVLSFHLHFIFYIYFALAYDIVPKYLRLQHLHRLSDQADQPALDPDPNTPGYTSTDNNNLQEAQKESDPGVPSLVPVLSRGSGQDALTPRSSLW